MEEVQRLLESSVPELEDYLSRELLTRAEVDALVVRRRDFETRLRRFEADRQDFLSYIEYELMLDKLLEKRKHKGAAKTPEELARAAARKHGPSDGAVVRRVNVLFDRALKKFPGDFALWMSAIAFSRIRECKKRTSKLLASALRIHPGQEGLWIMAAANEFEEQGDMPAARGIMLRGLRTNSKSQALYAEYLKLELSYVDKLVERRSILLGKNVEQVEAASAEEGVVRKGLLAIAVYQSGCAAVPDSCSFRVRMAEVMALYELEGARAAFAFALKDIEATFGPSTVEAWEAVARLSGEGDAAFARGCGVLARERPDLLPKLWEARIQRAADAPETTTERVLELSHEAQAAGACTPAVYELWAARVAEAAVPSSASTGKTPSKRAKLTSSKTASNHMGLLEVCEAATTAHPSNPKLWLMRGERAQATLPAGEVEAIYAAGIASVEAKDAYALWVARVKVNPEAVWEALRAMTASATCYGSMENELLYHALLSEHLLSRAAADPLSAIREVEKRGTPARVPSEILLRLLEAFPSKVLFEAALARDVSSASIWTAYAKYERAHGTTRSAKEVLSRALNSAVGKQVARELATAA